MEATVENAELVKLHIEDREGRPHTGVFNGVPLAEIRDGFVYHHEDGRFIVYDVKHSTYADVRDPEDLHNLLDLDDYVEVMNSLGITPEIDL